MTLQIEILSDIVRRERAVDESPQRLERRRMAQLLETIRCCTQASPLGRLRDAFARPAAGCCATA
jgi:hypothetical protein